MNQSAVDAAIVPSLPEPLTLDKQGELIDRIEYHVTQATDYVDYGRSEIGKAKEYMIKARKKKIFIIICLAVTLTDSSVALGTSLKRTVACSHRHSTFAATEEDHDPCLPAHTGHRHRGLRVQLFRLSDPHSYTDHHMLKGPSCKEQSSRKSRCLRPTWQQSTFTNSASHH
ncbi:unnamed protein product [Arctia plantaginis]|uniref:t-SNARE coiled-coil homology domain-containing protein n=1 Tax=Arctia plantaginis TaxID=874455 RepID=A0A8S1BED6_ARCPL|nr:unnamed protein product [Arctia plantaginis]CAB3255350.1 unnamed protein product [Arctia plantaginis]